MDRLPSERSGPGVPPPPPLRAIFEDAVRYWEPRRLGYNLALSVQAVFWVVRTWPHFRPAFTLQSLPPLVVLAALANVCYCAVYAAEVLVQSTAVREIWRRRRSGRPGERHDAQVTSPSRRRYDFASNPLLD